MAPQLKEIEETIWNVRTADLPKSKAVPISLERVLVLTSKNFVKNKCALRASSLTFLTLMSIVPVVALILGISRGFAFEEKIRDKLKESFTGQDQVVEWILSFADKTLKVAAGGVITGVGVAMLFFTALKLLANIESSFNDIWGIKQGRTMLRKLSDYITLLLLCPVFAVVLIGISALGVTRIEHVIGIPGKGLILNLIRYVSPFLLAWTMFFFLYLFIPNTRVKPKAAFAGAVLTGTLFIVIQYVYMILQTILTSYNAIYGSFAAMPFFLLWLQASWTVILLGAQLSFAVQNVNYYEFYPGDLPLSMHYRSVCAVRIMRLLGEAFNKRSGDVTVTDISSTLEIPIRITRTVLYDLMAAGLVIEVMNNREKDDAFVIKVPPEDFIPTTILERLSNIGDSGYKSESDEAREAETLISSLWSAASGDASNAPLVTFTRAFEDPDGKPATATAAAATAKPAAATSPAVSKSAATTPSAAKPATVIATPASATSTTASAAKPAAPAAPTVASTNTAKPAAPATAATPTATSPSAAKPAATATPAVASTNTAKPAAPATAASTTASDAKPATATATPASAAKPAAASAPATAAKKAKS